jgi:hypothetical protein
MRWVVMSLLALALGQTTDLPPAYPRPGATLMLENARVLVWNISWLKQQYPLHRHRYDLVGVYYAPGDRIIVSTDGSRRPVSTEAWQTAFQKSGVTHVEEGASDSPLRAVFVELKEPAASGHVEPTSSSAAFAPGGGKPLTENERSIVWQLAPVPPSAPHRHLRDAVVVGFDAGTPRVVWVPAGTTHSEEIAGKAERIYVIELK